MPADCCRRTMVRVHCYRSVDMLGRESALLPRKSQALGVLKDGISADPMFTSQLLDR
jgi:hypothetical protein